MIVGRKGPAVAKSIHRGVAVTMRHFFPLHPLSSLGLQCSTADWICETRRCDCRDMCFFDRGYWAIRIPSFAPGWTCHGGRQTSARRRWL
jgi:hypothetical protein